MASGIKARVVETLQQSGSLSSGDMAELSQPANAEPAPDEKKTANKASAPPVDDLLLGVASSDSAAAEAEDVASQDSVSGYAFGNDPLIEVEVSESDKRAFEDVIVDDTRYARPFTLFNGKVHGTFRSRTADESRAILNELNRQWAMMSKDANMPASEYSTTMRLALLVCQVASLQGVAYPELCAPLSATAKVVDGKKEIVAPKWYRDMFVLFGGMSDGKQGALYAELCRFEQRYWTLVRHADDQNFWCPEESISA